MRSTPRLRPQVVDLGDQIVAFGEQDQGAAVGDFAGGGEFVPVA
jgi:hypothetical protein